MRSYDDELARAITYRFAPSMADALATMPVQEIAFPSKGYYLPLRADAAILYEKDLAAFGVRGHASVKDKMFSSYQLFSTREITTYRDAAEIVSYFFDKLKEEFIHAMVSGQLKEFGLGKV